MKNSKDLFIGININQKYNQKMEKIITLQDFLLILLFKELIDSLFLLLITLVVLIELKKNSYRMYFLPRVKITNFNLLIGGRNFYDQPINDQIRKYDEIRKIAIGKGDDYTTGYF